MNWIQEHQAWFLVAWPLLTAVFSVGYKYADSVPRIHATLSILSALGIDLPKLWDALGRLFTGNPPSGGGKLTELPGPMIKGNFPKPPPDNAAFSMLRKSGVFAIALTLCGCNGSGTIPPNVVQGGIAGIETAICIMNVARKDAGKPAGQVVADAIYECGTDAATIARILDSHHAASAAERMAEKTP